MSGYLWMIRRFGLRGTLTYERERRRRERIYGPFVPQLHGRPLLRALGATEEQVKATEREGLA